MGISLSCAYGKMTATSATVGRLTEPDYIAALILYPTEK
jgi:hypothetical protein